MKEEKRATKYKGRLIEKIEGQILWEALQGVEIKNGMKKLRKSVL